MSSDIVMSAPPVPTMASSALMSAAPEIQQGTPSLPGLEVPEVPQTLHFYQQVQDPASAKTEFA